MTAKAETAQIVMGNHEFNAGAYATRRNDAAWARPHSARMRWWDPNATTLDEAALIAGDLKGPDAARAAARPGVPFRS